MRCSIGKITYCIDAFLKRLSYFQVCQESYTFVCFLKNKQKKVLNDYFKKVLILQIKTSRIWNEHLRDSHVTGSEGKEEGLDVNQASLPNIRDRSKESDSSLDHFKSLIYRDQVSVCINKVQGVPFLKSSFLLSLPVRSQNKMPVMWQNV